MKRNLSQKEELELLKLLHIFLFNKSSTSTKKVRKFLTVSGRRASMLLIKLGWKRHRRNGSSGTVYKSILSGVAE